MLSAAEIDDISSKTAEKIVSKLAEQPVLLTIEQLRSRTTLSKSTIGRLVKKGTIPALRAGRRLLFNPDAVAAALAQKNK